MCNILINVSTAAIQSPWNSPHPFQALTQQTDDEDEEQPKDISAIWNLKWKQGEKRGRNCDWQQRAVRDEIFPVGEEDVYL